jgi:hypothetical protein
LYAVRSARALREAKASEVIANLVASARREDVFAGAFSRDDFSVSMVSALPGVE